MDADGGDDGWTSGKLPLGGRDVRFDSLSLTIQRAKKSIHERRLILRLGKTYQGLLSDVLDHVHGRI